MSVTTVAQSGTTAPPRRRSIRVREHAIGYTLIAPPVLFLALIIIYPSLKAIWDSLTLKSITADGGNELILHGPSLDNYRDLLTDSAYRLDRKAIVYTLQVTAITLISLFAICYPLAMFLRFSRSRLVGFFRTLSLIPLFIPTIVSAYAFISFYEQGDFLDVLLQNTHLESTVFHGHFPQLIDNTIGIVLGQVWNNIPITVLLIAAGLGEIDRTLIESARDVGAGYGRVFRDIIFPLTLRQSLVAFILAFIGVVGSYNIPALLGPTLPQMLGPAMNDNLSNGQVVVAQTEAVLTFVMAALVGLLYVVVVARQRRR